MSTTRRGIAYAITVWGLLFVWAVLHTHDVTIPDWVVMYTLTGLLLLAERFSIPISDRNSLYLETVFLCGFVFAFPVHLVIWSGVAFSVLSSVRYFRKRWYLQLLNASMFVAAVALADASVNYLMPGANRDIAQNPYLALGFCAAYFGFNLVFVAGYLLFTDGLKGVKSIRHIVTKEFLVIFVVTVLLGLLLSQAIQNAGLAGALLFTGLVLLVSYAYRDYFRMANHFKELSVRDELTGLYNHRWVQSWMDDRIAAKEPFAALMLDIDHFKKFNETWGHVRGDDALRELAEVLTGVEKGNAQVSRYSGEEFMIVIPDADLSFAQNYAERFREAVQAHRFLASDKLPAQHRTGHKLTVSVGVATFPDMAENKKDLLMMVDDALYKGKFSGRNKVSIYTSVLDEMKSDLGLGDENIELINTVRIFLTILNSKDRYTYAHTERNVRYVTALGRRLELPEEQLRFLRFGAFLHDIGKVEIPIEILAKRGPLTRDEWEIMKSHVDHGVNIIQPIASLAPCIPIVRHHHERFDGSGYPDKIAEHTIPIEARILTIADSFDAMTTSRPYQRKRSMEEAFEELRACAGKQFDPELVEPFIEVVREIGMLSTAEEEGSMA